MSEGVKVQFADVGQAGADIKTGSRDIEQIRSDVDAQLQKVTWEGEAQAAYFEAKRKWTEGMAELQRILGEVGNGVDAAVQKYQSMEQHVAQSWM